MWKIRSLGGDPPLPLIKSISLASSHLSYRQGSQPFSSTVGKCIFPVGTDYAGSFQYLFIYFKEEVSAKMFHVAR